MKIKINFILFATVLTFLFGKFLWNTDPHSQTGNAYAQAEMSDEKTEQKPENNDKPSLEDESKVKKQDNTKKEKKEKEEKTHLRFNVSKEKHMFFLKRKNGKKR